MYLVIDADGFETFGRLENLLAQSIKHSANLRRHSIWSRGELHKFTRKQPRQFNVNLMLSPSRSFIYRLLRSTSRNWSNKLCDGTRAKLPSRFHSCIAAWNKCNTLNDFRITFGDVTPRLSYLKLFEFRLAFYEQKKKTANKSETFTYNSTYLTEIFLSKWYPPWYWFLNHTFLLLSFYLLPSNSLCWCGDMQMFSFSISSVHRLLPLLPADCEEISIWMHEISADFTVRKKRNIPVVSWLDLYHIIAFYESHSFVHW